MGFFFGVYFLFLVCGYGYSIFIVCLSYIYLMFIVYLLYIIVMERVREMDEMCFVVVGWFFGKK